MVIETLNKEDFVSSLRGIPMIHFDSKGVIRLSHSAVKHLKLWDAKKREYSPVHICVDTEDPHKAEFAIKKDSEGWCLRGAYGGSAVFNNCALARHVIKSTWERCLHAVGDKAPGKMGFRIALLPLDDDKNKDVFALLRRK